MKLPLFCLLPVIICSVKIYSQQGTSHNFFEIEKRYLDDFKSHNISSEQGEQKLTLDEKYDYEERFQNQRKVTGGKFLTNKLIYNEAKKKLNNNEKQEAVALNAPHANWKEKGPFGSPKNTGAGRINRVYINPAFPQDMWAGATAGGVWKSSDTGRTWSVKTDVIPIFGVSDIATSPNDRNIIYIATGNADKTNIKQSIQTRNYYSLGVIKSTDGGETWATTGLTFELANHSLISRLLISPSNSEHLLAATNQGIYKSVNAGTTWVLTQTGDFSDMEFKPNDSVTVYGSSVSDIFKSTDAGTTWNKLTTPVASSVGRLELAVTLANPELLYAVGANQSTRQFSALYISTNSGSDWQTKTYKDDILETMGSYSFSVAVSPINPLLLYVGGSNVWKTSDGGGTWSAVSDNIDYNSGSYVYSGIHDLTFFPGNPSVLYAGCDGGVFRNEGTKWTDKSEGLAITEFYRIASAAANTKFVVGGTHNTFLRLKNGVWSQPKYEFGGRNCLIDPQDSNIVYKQGVDRSIDGGENFNTPFSISTTAVVPPLVFHPMNSQIIYTGDTNIWKINTLINTREKISKFTGNFLHYIAISSSYPGYIYAGNDEKMYSTTDGGESWKEILLPQVGSVTDLAIHPTLRNRIWVTISGYGSQKVYESSNSGNTWTDFSEGLPAIPINCIIAQNSSPDRIYVGTDAGIYFRDKNINRWLEYNDGLPKVAIGDIQINYATAKILVGTYGRGLWEGDLIQCMAKEATLETTDNKTAICEGDSLKIMVKGDFSSYHWSRGDTTQSINVNKTGTYFVECSDSNGCLTVSKSITISVVQNKTPSIVGNHVDSTACEGNPITLDIGSEFDGYTIKWNTGDTLRSIKVTKPGIYKVVVYHSAGCTGTSKEYIVIQGDTPTKPLIYNNKDTLVSEPANSYRWYIDGVLIPGATQRYFVPSQGSIGKKVKVEVFNVSGCSAMSDEFVISVTSIEEEKNEQTMRIYPNPAGETITLEMALETFAPVTFEITNTAGTSMQKFEFKSEGLSFSKNISLKEFPVGAYIVTVHSGGKMWVRKITKE